MYPAEIPIGVADFQSPYGSATKLMPNEELMMAMYDEPELVHRFLGLVTDGIIKLLDNLESWTGPGLLAHNTQNPIPGTCGLILWDDYISVLNPKLHMEFCAPCNHRLYERYGHGHLHTCGPYFPGFIDACLACTPRSMDVTIMRGMGKTESDLREFLSITGERGIRLFGSLDMYDRSVFDGAGSKPDQALLSARTCAARHALRTGGVYLSRCVHWEY